MSLSLFLLPPERHKISSRGVPGFRRARPRPFPQLPKPELPSGFAVSQSGSARQACNPTKLTID